MPKRKVGHGKDEVKSQTKKSRLGQFFTTNYVYILDGMVIPDHITHIIEPFVGNGDLLQFIESSYDSKTARAVLRTTQRTERKFQVETYDIDPKIEGTIRRDTLKDPPSFVNKYVITNPPYLARNKNKDKTLYDLYEVNDLYKCFIKVLTRSIAEGGIIIVPLNFISGIRKADIQLRKSFLSVYTITRVNIFEERVFDDTSYTVCAVQFEKGLSKEKEFPLFIYPSKDVIYVSLNQENNFIIGGELYNLPLDNSINIARLIIPKGSEISEEKRNLITRLNVRCVDNSSKEMISMEFKELSPKHHSSKNQSNVSLKDFLKDLYPDETDKSSARTFCTLQIDPPLSENTQRDLATKFNMFLNEKREQYHSLFLVNYRESKDIARKRISFDLVYRITNYVLHNLKTS